MRNKDEAFPPSSSRGRAGGTSTAQTARQPRDPSPMGRHPMFEAEEMLASHDQDRRMFGQDARRDPVEEKVIAYAPPGNRDTALKDAKPTAKRDATKQPRKIFTSRRALPDQQDDPSSRPGAHSVSGYRATNSRNTTTGNSADYYAGVSHSGPAGSNAVPAYGRATFDHSTTRASPNYNFYAGERNDPVLDASVTPVALHAARVAEDEADFETRVNERVQKEAQEIERRLRHELTQSGPTSDDASNQLTKGGTEDDDETWCGCNKWVVILAAFVGLVIVIAVISAAIVLASGSPQPPPASPAPTPSRSIPSTEAPTAPQACTLCADGTVPDGIETNNVLAEEHAFVGEGDLTCSEFAALMGSIDVDDSDCAANQAVAWNLCSCPTLPPPVGNPSCTFCEGGAAFVGSNASSCDDLQTYTGLVNASFPALMSSCDSERKLAAGCECPEGVIGIPGGDVRVEAFTEALMSVSGDLLADPGSNQYRALNWLATQDEMVLPVDTPLETLTQRYIAALFFYETGGDEETGGSWTQQLEFLSGQSECNWNDGAAGLGCNDQGELIVIQISENGLIGKIPDEISFLQHLTTIKLDGNSIGGTLPASIGSLSTLGRLELDRNHLSSTIPDGLFTIPTLRRVWIDNNTLSGELPSTLSGAASLTSLALATNRLQGTIPDISALTGLDYLGLFTNMLSGPLPSFETIPWIRFIWLYQNSFTGQTIPPSIGQLTQLSTLALYQCGLNGPVPSFSNNNGYLENLFLFNNSLTGDLTAIIDDLASIDYGRDEDTVGLVGLILEENDLSGTIPASLGRLTALERIWLGANPRVSGTVPSELSMLERTLIQLNLRQSNLMGTIPTELGLLTMLTELSFYNSSLSGPIPSELGQLSKILYLDLQEQKVAGTIPDSFGRFSDLVGLGLAFNQLSGTVPESLNHPELEILRLQGNNFTSLPPAFCSRSDPIDDFIADCGGATPKVSCPCCLQCCPDGTINCTSTN